MKGYRHLLCIVIWSSLSSAAIAQHYHSFPHLVSGGGWASDIYLNNQGGQSVSDVQVSFFDDNGTPLPVSTNLGTNAAFTLTLAAGETKSIQTNSTGTTLTGYVVVRFPSSASIRGSEIFRYGDAVATITQVGVQLQSPFQHYSFPAEIRTSSVINTGVALANPVLGTNQNRQQDTVINLIRSDGTLQQSTIVRLAAGQHVARFLDQLFPGLDNFAGTLSISSPSLIGVLGLRQNGNVYASVSISYGPVLGPFMQTAAPIPETEPNNDRTQANSLSKSGTISGTIASSIDVDYFSFAGRRDDVVSFLLDTQSSASYLDSVIRLEKADGTVVAENDQNGLLEQNDSFLQAALPEDGTYYLRIVDYWGDGGSTYTYRLHVNLPAQQSQPAPQISSINPNNGIQGSTVSLSIQGSNLTGVSSISFTPSTGISVSGIQATATQVTCSVVISSSAATGARTVSVSGPGGASNTLSFTVNAATTTAPSITSISPTSGKQGTTTNLTISGSNLSGATGVNFSSSAGVTVSGIQSTASQVTCSVVISATATTGSRSVTVTTPGGTSNSLTFSVTSSTSGTAPTVSNISVTPLLAATNPDIVVQLKGSFDFTDPDGDIIYTGSDSGSAKIRFTMTGLNGCTLTSTGPYLDKAGVTSGHVEFTTATFKAGTMSLGTFTVTFRLIDAAGNQSNSLSTSQSIWYCQLLRWTAPEDRVDDFDMPGALYERRRLLEGVRIRRG
jgi:hypothetical protein